MTKSNIESVCIFGSAARASTDGLSDRDVLVVASNKLRRDNIAQYWRKLGWSVAVYTPSRILKMISSRSLFIRHLKQEGMIIEDRNRWLENQLNQSRMKRSYASDAQSSVLLAMPIERLDQSKFINEVLIAADLAYVSVRNYGICYLADRGRLTFEYSQIVEDLAKDFDLSKREVFLLQSMRVGKVSYRSNIQCSEIVGTVDELMHVLSKFFYQRPLSKIEQDSPIRDLHTGYNTLRDFEAWMVSAMILDTAINDKNKNIRTLKKWIYSPRGYSWDIRNISLDKLNGIKQAIEYNHAIFMMGNEMSSKVDSGPSSCFARRSSGRNNHEMHNRNH